MMFMKKLFALLLLSLPVLLYGQSTSEPDSGLVIIELKNGDTLNGVLKSKTDSTFKVLLDIGAMDVNRASVKSIRQRSRTGNDRFDRPNRYPNRYFLTNSAIPLEPGTHYYQNTYIVFNSVTTSLGPKVSLSAGFEYLSMLNSEESSPFMFSTLKINLLSEGNVHFAVDASAFSLAGEGALTMAGGKMTLGDNESNGTVSANIVRHTDVAETFVLITAGFQKRASKTISVVAEGFIPTEDADEASFVLYGIRYHAQRSVISLGFFNNADIIDDFPIGIPYLDVAIRF
jgi:small nuclear ribonucleoprotein (snRNP)-like protein